MEISIDDLEICNLGSSGLTGILSMLEDGFVISYRDQQFRTVEEFVRFLDETCKLRRDYENDIMKAAGKLHERMKKLGL